MSKGHLLILVATSLACTNPTPGVTPVAKVAPVSPPVADAASFDSMRAAHVAALKDMDFDQLGQFDQRSAPLALTIEEVRAKNRRCEIVRNTDAYLATALTGHVPPWADFFPTEGNTYAGFVIVWGAVGALDSEVVDAYDIQCPNDDVPRGHLFALRSTKQIFVVAKEINVHGNSRAENFAAGLSALRDTCSGGIRPTHRGTSAEREQEQCEVLAAYCDRGFMRVALANSPLCAWIPGAETISVAYVDRGLWDRYVSDSRAHKRKAAGKQADDLRKKL